MGVKFKSLLVPAFFIFCLAFFIQSFDLHSEGRTWDEPFKTDTGITAINNITLGKYNYSDWSYGIEHPPVAKYIYGYLYLKDIKTFDTRNTLSAEDTKYIQDGNYYARLQGTTAVVFPYDYVTPRLFSVICNALTITIVFCIAQLLWGELWIGLATSVVFLSIPRFIAMGRLVTYESLSGMLTAFLFLLFLIVSKKNNIALYWSVAFGLLLGLLLWTRYNNISVFLIFAGWIAIWVVSNKKNSVLSGIQTVFLSFFIAGVLGFIIWPFLWIEFPRGVFATVFEHHTRTIVPSIYHLKSLLVTTPIFHLLLLLVGIVFAIKKKDQTLWYVLWWFFGTGIFFTAFSSPTGGTRYIYTIYPSILLLIGYGLKGCIPKKLVAVLIVILSLYGLYTLTSIHPYYLDYYNGLVGGVENAAKNGYEVSWWGEGQKEAEEWLRAHAETDSKVALFVTPKYIFPRIRKDVKISPYDTGAETADYMVVSRADMPRFLKLNSKWKKVYVVSVQDVPLVFIWKRIK